MSLEPTPTGDEVLWDLIYPIAMVWLLIRSLFAIYSGFYFGFVVNSIVGILVFMVLFYRQRCLQKFKRDKQGT